MTTSSEQTRDSLLAELTERGLPVTVRDGEVALEVILDNDVSKTPWPWDSYIGQSKTQRILLSILHDRDFVTREGLRGDDVWRGAVSLKAITRVLFKGRNLTNAERASLSRSIRRLEQDGLINRERGMSDDGYTTHIGLTQRGWYQAEFNRTWYTNKQEGELLTFWGLKSSKYGKKVNKEHQRVNSRRKGGKA